METFFEQFPSIRNITLILTGIVVASIVARLFLGCLTLCRWWRDRTPSLTVEAFIAGLSCWSDKEIIAHAHLVVFHRMDEFQRLLTAVTEKRHYLLPAIQAALRRNPVV